MTKYIALRYNPEVGEIGIKQKPELIELKLTRLANTISIFLVGISGLGCHKETVLVDPGNIQDKTDVTEMATRISSNEASLSL